MSASRGSWRLAARLARRETRHRPARTLLVLLLIAVPVFALTTADVLVRAANDSPLDRYRRAHGETDVALLTDPARFPADFFTGALAPRGSQVVRFKTAELPLTPADTTSGERSVQITDATMPARFGAAGIEITNGRPAHAGEVVITSPVANWLHLRVGATMRLSQPAFAARVVGIGRSRTDYRKAIVDAPGFDFSVVHAADTVREAYVIKLPTHTSGRVVNRLFGIAGVVGMESGLPDRNVLRSNKLEAGPVLFWSWVAVALILAMVAVIIAAAFATTARRQLVMLGQLSANGADPRFLRRALTLQGTFAGAIGATAGIGVAAVALVVFRNFIVTVMRHDPGSFDFSGRDLIALGVTAIAAATIAARVPSREATRVPVLTALAGRRPLAPVPPLRWLKSVIVFGVGVGLLTLVAVNARSGGARPGWVSGVAIFGGLLVLAGAAYLTPVVVTLAARLGHRLGAASRIALRSLVRVRGRSAAVVTAVAIAGALAVAGATAMLGLGADRSLATSGGLRIPLDAVLIAVPRIDGPGAPPDVEAGLRRGEGAVLRAVPGTTFHAVRGFRIGAAGTVIPVSGPVTQREVTVVVADRAVLNSVGLDQAAQRRLRSSGAVSLAGGSVPTTIIAPSGPRSFKAVSARAVSYWPAVLGPSPVLVSPHEAERLGVPNQVMGSIGTAPHSLSAEQRTRLRSGNLEVFGVDQYPAMPNAAAGYQVEVGEPFDTRTGLHDPATVRRWTLAAALVFAFLVVAIALLLGASESRDERELLDALGARPRTERRIGVIKNWVLTFSGAVLAVPVGFVPVAVVFRALQRDDVMPISVEFVKTSRAYPGIVFPTTTVVGVLVVIPLVAALGTWVATSIAQRTRPAFRGTLTFDAD